MLPPIFIATIAGYWITKKTSENILPSKPEQDNDVKSVLSNDPAHGNDGEEQVSSSEVEEETIRDSSLSGNNLEE